MDDANKNKIINSKIKLALKQIENKVYPTALHW